MKIMMVSPECLPYAKSGGLGDAVSSLSIELARAGFDVKVILPRYYSINKVKLESKGNLGIPTGKGEIWVEVFIHDREIGKGHLQHIFLDNEALFGRNGIYGSTANDSFIDNFLRFTVLSRGAIQVCLKFQWFPDIIHCHDWASALTLVYLRYQRPKELAHTAGVFSIHNLAYQGHFDAKEFSITGLDKWIFYDSGMEYYGNINLMKAGIINANKINTVSSTYADEIQNPKYGEGLDTLLKKRNYKLQGILNGIDYNIWNPSIDKKIAKNYTYETIENKKENKKELQKLFSLKINLNIPIIGIVSRLVNQKGIGELLGPTYGPLYDICNNNKMQFIVIGNGEQWAENELISLSHRLNNLAVFIGYNEEASHKLIAGSDFLMVPSIYEPCGLTQIYAMKYGTVPIVSETGGLYETVYNEEYDLNKATGYYIYHPINPHNIYHTTKKAIDDYHNEKQKYKILQRNGMQRDFSWTSGPIQKYEILYKEALNNIKDY